MRGRGILWKQVRTDRTHKKYILPTGVTRAIYWERFEIEGQERSPHCGLITSSNSRRRVDRSIEVQCNRHFRLAMIGWRNSELGSVRPRSVPPSVRVRPRPSRSSDWQRHRRFHKRQMEYSIGRPTTALGRSGRPSARPRRLGIVGPLLSQSVSQSVTMTP